MKKIIGILSLILVLGSATLVSAAAGDNIYFNLSLTSGNTVYSGSKANYSGKASIVIATSDVTLIDCYTVSTTTGKTTTSVQLSGGDPPANYSNVNSYSGEAVKAAFVKTGIEGTKNFDGRFYYDGGI